MWIFQIIMGWPAIIASLTVSAIGIRRGRLALVAAGGLVGAGFALYLSMTPRFHSMGLLLPLFHLGAAWAVHRRLTWLAWLMLLPFAAIAGWLAVVVIGQNLAG